MPRPKQSDGFLIGNQRMFVNHGKQKRERSAEANARGSWWIGVSRESWSAKCAEVFPEVSASKEVRKMPRDWSTP